MGDLIPKEYRRVVLWQNLPSHHQAGYVSELASRGLDVAWMVQDSIADSARSGMGWPEFESSTVRLKVSPSEDEIIAELEADPERTLHVFSGVFFVPLVRRAFILASRRGLNLALMTEPPIPAGVDMPGEQGGKLRKLKFVVPLAHKVFRFAYKRQIKAVFCIGKMARDWATATGYTDAQIFPWAYFPVAPPYQAPTRESDHPFGMIYMGQLTPRKGVDLMIEAALTLPGENWRLKVIGKGDLSESLESRVREAGKEHLIEFHPFLPWAETMQWLAEADLALVPSRHDGWGAVVSESLMQGVPVICTDHTGAQDLVQHPWRGAVVPAGDAEALRQAMIHWMDQGSPCPEDRARIRRWSHRAQGVAAANYLIAVLAHLSGKGERPSAPWFADEPLPEAAAKAP